MKIVMIAKRIIFKPFFESSWSSLQMQTEDNQEHQATAADYCVYSNVLWSDLEHTLATGSGTQRASIETLM